MAATDGEAAKRSERPSWARVETRGGIQPGLKLTRVNSNASEASAPRDRPGVMVPPKAVEDIVEEDIDGSMPETRKQTAKPRRERAVRIVFETGKTVAQVARDLDVNERTLAG